MNGQAKATAVRDLWPIATGVALGVLLLGLAIGVPDWARRVPDSWQVDMAGGLNRLFAWLSREAHIGPLAIKEITRALGAVVEVPLNLVRGLLAEGFRLRLPGGLRLDLVPLPWWALIVVWTLAAFRIGGRNGAVLVFGSCLYFLMFGLWEPAMFTLASVALSVLVGAGLGMLLGAWAWRWQRLDTVLTVLYDIMQTLPVFSYLVPILLFFGFGPVAALLATVIYAMPPMARNTTLALRGLPQSVHDLATMTGCTPRQRQWLVLLPAARQGLLTGLNQVIMLSLSAVIIASIIGAGGLGNDVLQGLKSMRLGRALEAGLGITLMAIVLDRLSRSYAQRQLVQRRRLRSGQRSWLVWGSLGFLLLSQIVSQVLPPLRDFPEGLTLSTGKALDDAVAWLNLAWQGPIAALSDGTVRWLLRPMKDALLGLPWLGVTVVIALIAAVMQDRKLALTCVLLLSLLALTGFWDQAMISLYLALVSTLIAMVLGLPIGLWAGQRPEMDRVVTLVIDTLQTLPTFVYLIPVVMLFGLGDFPAMVAIVLYALPPAIRYAKDGIARVPQTLIEAANMAGCSRWQRLWLVHVPQALPELMLGLSQTLLMAFGMLVITALVGTRGLEQEALVAVSKAKVGEGLIAGLGISALSIMADRLITAASFRLRHRLGQG
jgi:glycine betaine/proline transport system permease protein